MEFFTTFQKAVDFAAEHGGHEPSMYSSDDRVRMRGYIDDMGYCAVAGHKITHVDGVYPFLNQKLFQVKKRINRMNR